MSPSPLRLLAACLWALAAGSVAAAGADDAWTPLGALPGRLDTPVFALASDPADGHRLLAGTGEGALFHSADAGATWAEVESGLGRGVAALAFDPARPGVALAGTRGAGVWSSADGGLTWQPQAATAGRTVRAFAFLGDAVLAGGDQGVMVSRAGGPWSATALAQVRVSALAAGDVVAVGGDASRGGEPLPLYLSGDGGRTWAAAPGVAGPNGAAALAGSALVAALAPAAGDRPLLMGTEVGLFASPDRGATWQQVTGGGTLPGTDVTALAASPRHPERLYAASDGGGSDRGGLWASGDGGDHFTSLAPPMPEVTAVSVSADDVPQVVVATFRPADHAVALWTYRDAGGSPSGSVAPPAPAPGGSAPARAAAAPQDAWRTGLAQPETPYLAVGLAALLAVVAALAAYARRGRVP